MRYLVTGAGGFVGSHLHDALRAEGHEVVGTARTDGPGLYACDMRDPDAVESAVERARPERVFHLAAQSSAGRSWTEPALTYEVNVTGSHYLLDALHRRAPDARVLLACTSDEYGAVAPEQCPVDETVPLRPLSPYAASKVAAEWVGRMFHAAFDMQIVITRAFMHIGPGQPPRFATADWARQVALAERGERGRPGEAYNIATGRAPSLKEALDILLSRATVPLESKVDPSKIRPADPPVLQGSAAKLESLTGWRPKRRLEDTLAEVLDYWRAAG